MRQQWFTHVRLPVAHLTRSRRAFSATLTTSALDRRSLRWFGASPCRAAPEGQTSISCTVTHTQVITILYIVPYLPALVAHELVTWIRTNLADVHVVVASEKNGAPEASWGDVFVEHDV